MKSLDKELHNIPTYALPYLVNGDDSGITPEDKAIIDAWYSKTIQAYADELGASVVLDASGDFTFFTHYPTFGLPCECTDVVFVFLGEK